MNTLIHVIYASTAAPAFAASDIPMLLARARTKNVQLGITGMLLDIEGSFFHIVEGPQTAVSKLFAEVRRDARHQRVTQLIREPILQRSFADCAVGYSKVGFSELGRLIGEHDFFTDSTCLDRLGTGRARKLLHAFQCGGVRLDDTGVLDLQSMVA